MRKKKISLLPAHKMMLRELHDKPNVWADVPSRYQPLVDGGFIALESTGPRRFNIRLTASGTDALERQEDPDGSIDVITGQQIREARELLGWTSGTLAKKASIRVTTLNRAELLDEGITAVRAKKIQRALEAAGVEFTDGDPPGVSLRRG